MKQYSMSMYVSTADLYADVEKDLAQAKADNDEELVKELTNWLQDMQR